MGPENILQVQVGQVLGGDGLVGTGKHSFLGQHADKSSHSCVGDAVRANRWRQVSDQVKGDVGVGPSWDRVGLEEAWSGLSGGFDALEGGAGADVGLDGAGHVRPPEPTSNSLQGLLIASMASCWCIMEFPEELQTHSRVLGHTNAILKTPQLVIVRESEEGRKLGRVVGVKGVGVGDVSQEGVRHSEVVRGDS